MLTREGFSTPNGFSSIPFARVRNLPKSISLFPKICQQCGYRGSSSTDWSTRSLLTWPLPSYLSSPPPPLLHIFPFRNNTELLIVPWDSHAIPILSLSFFLGHLLIKINIYIQNTVNLVAFFTFSHLLKNTYLLI